MPLDLSSQPELALPFESTRALLTKWRSRDADKTAIVDLDQDGKSISWGEIAIAADKVAKFLSDRDIKPGDNLEVFEVELRERTL